MGDLLEFLKQLDDELTKTVIENISLHVSSEEERLLYLIELHLSKLGFTDLAIAQKILDCLLEIRLETANRYGNSFIYKNFLGLQALKVFQIDKAIVEKFYEMQYGEMLIGIRTFINNESYCNDNNTTICSKTVTIDRNCPKCGFEKMNEFKSELKSLGICERCCFSIILP